MFLNSSSSSFFKDYISNSFSILHLMQILKIVSLLFILLLLSSCEGGITFDENEISMEKKIKKFLTDDKLHELGIDQLGVNVLNEFYKTNEYHPKWIQKSSLTKEGKELKKLLLNTFKFGIPANRYPFLKSENSSILKDELMITLTLAYFANDLKIGFIDTSTTSLKPLIAVSIGELKKITEFNDAISLSRQLIQFGPSDTNYQKLAVGLVNFCSNYPVDTTRYFIQSSNKDSIIIKSQSRKALFSKGYLANVNGIDSLFYTALKLFQTQNGLTNDGKIGFYTVLALNESSHHKLLRTSLTMEKWRWKNQYPKKFIQINIPEYKLRLFENDSLLTTHRIIVGKPVHQTPELNSKIRQIVLFPYWHVPNSIARNEMLLKVRKDSDYFKKNELRIFKNEKEIDPHSVDWQKVKDNTFPYAVRQDYGPKNSLGILKFEFFNPFSVYIHDTPEKSLFNKEIRSFSHGCIRCENPVELVKLIVENDSTSRRKKKLNAISLDSLLEIEQTYFINLVKKIPLFVEYKTVTIHNNFLLFYHDIYGKDEKYIALF